MGESQFYAYVRFSYFDTFCIRKGLTKDKSETLDLFLSEIGTPFLTTSYFIEKHKDDLQDMFSAYVPIKPGKYVKFVLSEDEYYNQLN